MFGPNKDDTAHGVVRFGGHIENSETSVECAIREAAEEANVKVALINSPQTFYMENENTNPIPFEENESLKMQPVLYSGGTMSTPMSVTYIGSTTDTPQPSMETKGILLLSNEEIRRICDKNITLGQLIEARGQIIEKEKLDREYRLVPYLQLKFLNWALKRGNVAV